jgi:photosystem II stability/assembly factor-like uncharacterized protein
MKYYTFFATSALAHTASAATWQFTDFDRVTSVGGVFATSDSDCYVAYTDNAKGPGIYETHDYGATWTMNGPNGFLNTDTARDSLGNEVISGIGGIFFSQKNGPYNKVSQDISFSQNVETLGDNSFGVSGSHFPLEGEMINGVALTTDAGNTWSYFDTGLDPDLFVARYAAFPSPTTWYVAQGSWISIGSSGRGWNTTDTSYWHINSRISVSTKTGAVTVKAAPTGDRSFGAISKTTDGGKTFTKVYDSQGAYYMNEIDCFNTEVCMAVGENGESAIALRTEDGGKTWNTVKTKSSPAGFNLMGCKMLSEKEAWISGGTFEKGMVGYYFHTTDGGKTWTEDTLEKGYSIDLSFADGVGYSPAMMEFGSRVAVYK